MTPYRERREAGAYAPTQQPTDPIEVRADQVEAEEGERQAQAEEGQAEEGQEESGEAEPQEEVVAYGPPRPRAAQAQTAEPPPKRPRGRPRKNPLPGA